MEVLVNSPKRYIIQLLQILQPLLYQNFFISKLAVHCHRGKAPAMDYKKIIEHWTILARVARELKTKFKVVSADGDGKVRKAFLELSTSKVSKIYLYL